MENDYKRFQVEDLLPRRKVSGFTLIELLVSLVITAIVLLATTSMMDIIQNQNWFSYHFSVSSFLSQSRLAELENLGYSSPGMALTFDWTPRPNPEFLDASGQAGATGFYLRQWKITSLSMGPIPQVTVKKIEVQTTWKDRNQRTHRAYLTGVRGSD